MVSESDEIAGRDGGSNARWEGRVVKVGAVCGFEITDPGAVLWGEPEGKVASREEPFGVCDGDGVLVALVGAGVAPDDAGPTYDDALTV